MKPQMNSLLEALRVRVKKNLEAIHSNEEKIRQILKEPLSSNRSAKLKSHFNFSRSILDENMDSLKIQKKLQDFLSKYEKLPEFKEELTALYNNLEHGENEQNQSNSDVLLNLIKEFDDFNKSFNVNVGAEQDTTESVNSIFSHTIQGELNFDANHPMFNNDNFYNKLLNFYIVREEYEICAKIKKAKDL